MTGETYVIDSYGDVARLGKLSHRDVDVVAELLLEHGLKPDWVIARVSSSMLESKVAEHGIATAKGSDQIVHGRKLHETEAAVRVAIGREQVWFPKSTLMRFERGVDAEITIPKRELSEFVGGEA